MGKHHHGERSDREYTGGGSSSKSGHGRRKSNAHKLKYDPSRQLHQVEHAEDHHHHATKAIQRLHRGNSGRKLAEEEKKAKAKKEAEKERQRAQQRARKEKGMKGQPEEEESSLHMLGAVGNDLNSNAKRNEAEQADGKKHKKGGGTRAAPGAYNHFTAANAHKVHVDNPAERRGGYGDNYLVDVDAPPSSGRSSGDSGDDLEAQKKLVIHPHDDEETKAYKAKLNYLNDQKRQKHKKGADPDPADDEATTRTDAADDCCVLSTLGCFLLAYYGFVFWVGLAAGQGALAIALGVGLPFML
jgi:hypothetical protein